MGTKKKARGQEAGTRERRDGPRQVTEYPLELRLRAVKEVLEHETPSAAVARALGIPNTTLAGWVTRYELHGADGLLPQPRPVKRAASASDEAKRQAVVEMRQEHPDYGTRRIRDSLARFSGLGVLETEVRRILHEAGLIEPVSGATPREKGPRRFERAEPNQLWQSDIFTFLLRRYQRIYVAAFLDDHSRFLVSHAIAHHQKASLVMEALHQGVAAFGAPREILTDHGRQYTAWRGSTEFEEELRREGIVHVKSRPQHPQTLGKIERFWRTLWEELLSRTVFADFADLTRRVGLFVDAYNFQRPHQALAGLVPADRFFRAAPQVREAIEKGVADNAMRLAREQPPRKPFYLVGRLGDRDLSIAASGRGLQVQLGDEAPETIDLRQEADDGQAHPNFQQRPLGTESAWTAQEAQPAGPQMAQGTERSGRHGASPVSDGAQRLVGGADGHGCDRGGEDLARPVLPAGNEGDPRDPGRATAGGRGDGQGSGDVDAAHGRAREQGGAARAREAAARAAAARDAATGTARPGVDADGPGAAEISLDDDWGERFAELGEGEEDRGDEGAFDVDNGWRGRALCWERKLAGAAAPADDGGDEEQALGLRGCAADERRGAAPLPGSDAGARRGCERDCGGGAVGAFAQSLPNADAPRAEGACGGTDAQGSGTTGDAGPGGAARAGGNAPSAGEPAAASSGGDVATPVPACGGSAARPPWRDAHAEGHEGEGGRDR